MANELLALSTAISEQIAKVAPSVVRVEGRRRRPSSGLVWAEGVVIASAHAVEQEDQVRLGLHDGTERTARVVGREPSADVAVLKVDGKTPPPAPFSSLEGVAVGNLVLRAGRPGRTVRATFGMVSAFGEGPFRLRGGTEVERYLESDAPHIPGLSGGALLSADGKVLGMNTTGALRGTNLTIPTATLNRLVDALLAHGKVRKSYLGLASQPVKLPEELRQSTGEDLGLLVLDVEKGGPSDQAGIRYGDTVLRLGGDHVQDLFDLRRFLNEDHVGEAVFAKVLRGGQVADFTITVGARP